MKTATIYPGGIRPAHPPKWFRGDGCTASPDFTQNIRKYCRIHDWAYAVGGGKKQKKAADRRLRDSLIHLGEEHISWYKRGLHKTLAYVFYAALRAPYFSSKHFYWGFNRMFGKEESMRGTLRSLNAITVEHDFWWKHRFLSVLAQATQ